MTGIQKAWFSLGLFVVVTLASLLAAHHQRKPDYYSPGPGKSCLVLIGHQCKMWTDENGRFEGDIDTRRFK